MDETTDPREAMLERQRFGLAIVGGVIGVIVMTGAWVGVYLSTAFHSFLLALVLGIVVGLIVRVMGRGCTPAFGVIGGVAAVLGTFLSYVLVVQAMLASNAGVSLIDQLTSQSAIAPFSTYLGQYAVPFHLFAYVIAGLEGFSLSYRRV